MTAVIKFECLTPPNAASTRATPSPTTGQYPVTASDCAGYKPCSKVAADSEPSDQKAKQQIKLKRIAGAKIREG